MQEKIFYLGKLWKHNKHMQFIYFWNVFMLIVLYTLSFVVAYLSIFIQHLMWFIFSIALFGSVFCTINLWRKVFIPQYTLVKSILSYQEELKERQNKKIVIEQYKRLNSGYTKVVKKTNIL